MPRRPRLILPNVPLHLIQRGNNRQATNGNYALGDHRFGAQIETALKQRALPGKAGKPRKSLEPESGDLF